MGATKTNGPEEIKGLADRQDPNWSIYIPSAPFFQRLLKTSLLQNSPINSQARGAYKLLGHTASLLCSVGRMWRTQMQLKLENVAGA